PRAPRVYAEEAGDPDRDIPPTPIVLPFKPSPGMPKEMGDLLSKTAKLLAELEAAQGTLERKLDPAKSKDMKIEKLTIDKATFDKMHAADRMANDKLKEGIEGFSKALEDLEKMLAKRVSELRAEPVGAK
ncbi:MAG: hypothetical protein V4555_01970, partial [Acidobacteriota bacterium]